MAITNDELHNELERLKHIIEQQELEIVRLKSVIDNLPGSIYWKDIDGKYLGNNKFARDKMVGLDLAESVIGKTDYDLFAKEVAEEFRKNDLEVIDNNSEISREETTTLSDGREIFQLSRKRPLHDTNGKVIGIVGNTVDITELKTTQDKLRNVEDRLAGMLSLSASIAHELRTPITAIQFGVSGVKEYLPSLVKAYNTAKKHQLKVDNIQSQHLKILSGVFDTLESEVIYADTIINMILMNLKHTDIPDVNLKILSISSCVEEAIRRYPFKKEQRDLIEWSSEGDFSFMGEQLLMVHVLFNLMKNSFYYIEAENKGKIQIWFDSDEYDNILYFKDTAKGILEDVLPKLFEKFYSTTRHGTGLGLSYCKMIMTSFGGTITCQSTYGEFTQFTLTFPKIENN